MHPVTGLNELHAQLRRTENAGARRRLTEQIMHAKAQIGAMVEMDASRPSPPEEEQRVVVHRRAPSSAASSMAETTTTDASVFNRAPTLASSWAMPGHQVTLRKMTRPVEPAHSEPVYKTTREEDDQYLKDHGGGLFPDGIADLRREDLFMAARVSSTQWKEKGTVSYTVNVDLYDETYARRLRLGFMQLTYAGPTQGLRLGLFYGHQSVALPDETDVWKRIMRWSTINPRKYMISVLRAFILTRLVQFEHLSVLAPFTLTAIGSHGSKNNQRRLVWYYRSMGFVDKTPEVQKDSDAHLDMITSIGIFMDYTAHMSPWTANFDRNDKKSDEGLIFPVRFVGSGHLHLV